MNFASLLSSPMKLWKQREDICRGELIIINEWNERIEQIMANDHEKLPSGLFVP